MIKTAHITEVIELSEEDKRPGRALRHPVLVTFPRGVGPSGTESLSLDLYQDPDPSDDDGNKREILVCKEGRAEWGGKTGESAYPATYFAAFHSRKTGKVRLIEVDSSFTMRPRLMEESEAERNEPNDEQATSTKTNYEKREDLLKMFGGRRARRRSAAARRDEIRDGTVQTQFADEVVQAAVKQVEEDRADDAFGTELTTENLAPPHNSEAANVESAYPLDGLMCPHEWHAVKMQADEVITKYNKEEHANMDVQSGWHALTWKFLLRALSNESVDELTRHTRVMATFYLNILIAIAESPRKINESAKMKLMQKLGIDEEHLNYLLDKFSENSKRADGTISRQKSNATDDRLCYYAIVAWLTVEGFVQCGNLGEFAHALKVTPKVLAQCALRVGGKLQKRKSDGNSKNYGAYTVTLRVPLHFPLLNKSKKRIRSRRQSII